MGYDQNSDRLPRATPSRESPATAGFDLTAAMVSDTADLAIYGKAFRVYNMTAAAVKIRVTPLHAAADANTMSFTVGAGEKETFSSTCRRIWSAGSTGLTAGLTAGTVEVNVFTE